MDSSLEMIQVFESVRDEQGEIVDFIWIINNAASEQMYGDVIGKRLLELNSRVVETGIFDTFKKVVETGIPYQSERHYIYEQFDGWFYQSTVKLRDGVATTTTNITKHKKAKQEIKEQAHLILNISELMPDMVTVVELPSRNILYINQDPILVRQQKENR